MNAAKTAPSSLLTFLYEAFVPEFAFQRFTHMTAIVREKRATPTSVTMPALDAYAGDQTTDVEVTDYFIIVDFHGGTAEISVSEREYSAAVSKGAILGIKHRESRFEKGLFDARVTRIFVRGN